MTTSTAQTTTATTTTALLVRKDALPTTRLRTSDDVPLLDGQVQLGIDAFALTSNNITYAAFGDSMNYWQFYPTGEDGWGIVPVWGFATVRQSRHPEVAQGERLYGYWPMASRVVVTPERVSAAGFSDGAEHRRALHPLYNQMVRTTHDPFYAPPGGGATTAHHEHLQALLRPLYITSWLIDDFLADNDFFGATTVLLSSASSKTAYGTAFALHQRTGLDVVGLTSPGNVAFCESLGCYSRVLTYDQLSEVAADAPCVYVDFAGSMPLRKSIHTRFTQLKHSAAIGGTHVTELGGAKNLPGPPVTLFFAPAQVKKRSAEWGGAVFGQRMVAAWQQFFTAVTDAKTPWLTVQTHRGPDAVQAAYAQVLAGKGDPRVGHILSFNEA